MNSTQDKLQALRETCKKLGVDGFILPVNDEFQSEFVHESARRLEWLTGFTGSSGMVAVTLDRAAFFTDGRYTLQASKEVDKRQFEIFNMADTRITRWLEHCFPKGGVLGYDPWLHTSEGMEDFQASGIKAPFRLKAIANPIDMLWQGRPKPASAPAQPHGVEYSGRESLDKRIAVADAVTAAGAEALLVAAPENVCWLLNIRGRDCPRTPLLLCRALLRRSHCVTLYTDPAKITPEVQAFLGDEVDVKPTDALAGDLAAFAGKRVMLDASTTPQALLEAMEDSDVISVKTADPIIAMKAEKNQVESEGTRAAHVRDGVAVVNALCWLDATFGKQKLTELDIAAKLQEQRSKQDRFADLSFDTIAGFGSNGAIVHYRATEQSAKTFEANNLLLIDSGGQYLDGTTDITRTVALGTPTAEMKRHFTLVLKGHIALARAVFPVGTSGSQLDVLARNSLWQEALDYDHGTGHGVGSFLSVHEGPQRISKFPSKVALKPGMIISNEPGYYREGHYGIRIESLVQVVEYPAKKDGRSFYAFDTITCAPLDVRLMDVNLMTADEVKWVNEYHAKVRDALSGRLGAMEKAWLRHATKPLKKRFRLW